MRGKDWKGEGIEADLPEWIPETVGKEYKGVAHHVGAELGHV